MFGGFGAGCLPILIQMPIFAALFATARYTPGISSATFYGINLGKTSFALVIITGALYLLQSYLSMFNIPEDQKKQMQMMMYMSPIMMIFSLSVHLLGSHFIGQLVGSLPAFKQSLPISLCVQD